MSPSPAITEPESMSKPHYQLRLASQQAEPSTDFIEATIKHGRMTKNILYLSASSERFACHAETAKCWWHHLAYLVIDIHGIRSTDEALYLGDLLIAAAANSICKEILGTKPFGLVSVLRKSRAYPLPAGYYEKFLVALHSAKRSKILNHAPIVTPDLINVVVALPESVLSTKIVSALENSSQVEAALYYFDALLKIFPPEYNKRIRQSLSEVQHFQHFDSWFARWLEKVPPYRGPLVRKLTLATDPVTQGPRFNGDGVSQLPSPVCQRNGRGQLLLLSLVCRLSRSDLATQ